MELFIYIVAAVAGGFLADKRGRNGIGWGIAGIFITPFASLLLLICMKDLTN